MGNVRTDRWLLEAEELDWTDEQTERQLRAELRYIGSLLLRHARDDLFKCVFLRVLLDYVERVWNLLAPVAAEVGFDLNIVDVNPDSDDPDSVPEDQ